MVAELRSFTAAGAALHITQSAVSNLVKDLEDQIGVQLFDRGRRVVKLTAAGKIFFEKASRAQDVFRSMEQCATELHDARIHRVRIAAAPLLGCTLIPLLAYRFMRRYPEMRVELVDLPMSRVQQAVVDGSADLGYGPARDLEAGVTGELFFETSVHMLSLPQHPLAGEAVSWEQVRNSIAYPRLNVKVIGSHGGLSVGEDGATHQCNEDIALMRTIPGMVILNPADDIEAKACVKAAYEYNGPVYLRFGRLAAPVINDRPDYKFELGKGVVLREGKDLTIVATGLCVSSALEAAEKLAADGIDAKVINIHTIKPLDEELIVAAAKETGKVVTVEEHSVIGGLGSAVCDALAEKCPVPVKKIGVQDVFGESGPAVALLAKYKLDGEGVYEQVKEFCK